jgi:EpsD family peptidyl-prolyl cis-trans isomerase
MARKLILPTALVIALGAAISLGGSDTNSAAGEVAATVNGERIWAGQVDAVLAQSALSGKQAGERALERLIDQELLAQEARRAGLDRDPAVVQAMESARRQILGQAWLERAAAAGGESRAEVEKFYQENPALFRERRVYRVLELAAVVPQDMLAEIRKAATGAGNLNEMAAWLEARKLPYNVSTASRPAEQIPLHILPSVAGMHTGQIAVFPTARGASIVQLLRTADAPVNEREAAPVIERYLLNRRRVDVARSEVEKLRGQSAIEYLGDYAAPGKGTTPARHARAEMPGTTPGVARSN